MISWREAALLLLLLSPAYTQLGRAYSTVIQIAGWTTTGERLDKIWAVLTPVGGNEKYAGSGKLVELSVPTGEYILQVDAPGFEARRQILKAYQPKVFRSVALPVARLHGQMASSLTGTVRNYDGQIRDLRVRLMGLYGDEFQPEGRVENALVCALAIAMWRIIVFENQEADFLNSHPRRIEQVRGVCTIGRYRDRAECQFFHLLRFVRRYFFTIKPNSALQ